uniref:Uncharacterized protein n=1 Tax=Siphoviridae sp. ct3z32 TaxID=2825327 RepID=A0A8S5VHV3_9CAUD|nr:MAG TPA: hypothetical protein [Siphoviridae sp. ct3z32]
MQKRRFFQVKRQLPFLVIPYYYFKNCFNPSPAEPHFLRESKDV